MLRDLITNFAIITVFVIFVEQFFIITKLDQKPSWLYKIFVGISHGILIVILLNFGVNISDHISLNFRGVGLLLSAYLGGFVSLSITFIFLWTGRFLMEGSVQIPQLLIGIVAIVGTGFIFRRTRSYWLKWLYGEAFFFFFYYAMIGLIYRMPLGVVMTYITYQMICVFIVACFLRYLVRAREYKQKIRQVEQELIDMLRFQPGFTFKFHKHRDHFVYILIEGQLLYQIGMRPSQFIGKRVNEVIVLKKEFTEYLMQQYEIAWQGERITYEYDLEGYIILVTLQPIYKYGSVHEVIGSAVDVTEHRTAQMRAQVRDEQYRTLVENSEDFIFRFRLDGKISSANFKMYQTYQLTPAQVKGKPLPDVVQMDDPQKWDKAFVQTIMGGKTQQFAINLLQPDNTEHMYNVTLSPLFNNDRTDITGVTGTVHDITDLKKREEADESNRAKSQFLARMSHEIRTPLNGIMGLSLLLQRTDLNEIQKDYLSKMDASSRVLLATINDILDFSKIEAGKMTLEKVDFSLETSLQKVADLVGVTAGSKRIELMLDTSMDLPDIVSGDPFRLEQVLINLSNNAIKFTQDGYIRLKVQLEEYVEEGVIISFAVEDSGIGISKEQLSQLFLPFSQADTSTSRRYGGTGLGLVISQHLVQSMGGVLQVDTKLGTGSRFYFSLLFGHCEQVEERDNPEQKLGYLPGWNTRVLMAEDHPVVVEHITELLSSFQLHVEAVASMPDLLAVLEKEQREQGTAPDYLFVDMQMAQLQQRSSWQRVLNAIDRSQTKVIAFTTLEGREEMSALPKDIQADTIIVKPVSRLTLRKSLEALNQQIRRMETSSTAKMDDAGWKNGSFVSKGSILVAEDNEINQLVISHLLEKLGYQAVIARNGKEALAMIEQQAWKLILMDIHMPEMDGYEATMKLRQHKSMKEIPIIALTANVFMQDHTQLLKLGLNDTLIKPVDEKQLSDMIEKWLDLKWLFNIPGVDTERVMRNIDQRTHIFQYMLEKFRQDYTQFAEQLLPLVINQENKVARRMVHTLKGIAANFYADSLLAAVCALEKHLFEESPTEACKEGIAAVQYEIDRIIGASDDWEQICG
ncbi:response regulator [Paenibacillus alba]|uniref:histidine kinase n=1 Tax=Paenibacillus alba TaxID=1197127 RepID=A0ABU6FWN4_9BACL|nr:response regulator [Paenibacillus alba]MEC0226126.1 response regulator [Paenibacillus alba]